MRKTTRKVIGLLALLVAGLILISCGKKETKKVYTGTWELDSAKIGGSMFKAEELEALGKTGFSGTLIIKAGGSAVLISPSGYEMVDWKETDSGIIIGESAWIVDGDYLIQDVDGDTVLYFIKKSNSQTIPGNAYKGDEEEESDSEDEDIEYFSATIEETVILDESGVKITAKSLEHTEYNSILTVEIENNTEETLSFYSNTIGYDINAINQYMITDGYLVTKVKPGSKTTEKMSFDVFSMLSFGITDIKEITVGFDIDDEEGDDYIVTGPLTIETSATGYDMQTDTSVDTLFGEDYLDTCELELVYEDKSLECGLSQVDILATGILADEDENSTLVIGFENTGKKECVIGIGNIAINKVLLTDETYSSNSCLPNHISYNFVDIISLFEDYSEEGVDMILGADGMGSLSFDVYVKESGREIYRENYELVFSDSELEFSEDVLYDKKGIMIVDDGFAVDPEGFGIKHGFLVRNTTGKSIFVDTGLEATINGKEVSTLCICDPIPSGMSRILIVEFYQGAETVKSLEDIDTVYYTLEIYDNDYNTIATIPMEYE